jgi:hypothetical protein
MFTESELDNVLNWLPYRADWKVDRNSNDDFTNSYIKKLIGDFSENPYFKLLVTHDGGMSNYLEFVCYPAIQDIYAGDAIIVLISLCAPMATYGQIDISIEPKYTGHNDFQAEQAGVVTSFELIEIELEVKRLLRHSNILILDREYLIKPLPKGIITSNDFLLGDQCLHGIFQQAH